MSHGPSRPATWAGIAAGVLRLMPPGTEARGAVASHPPPAQLVATSSSKMLALHSVHTAVTVSLWSSGTHGNHIPVTVSEAITGECSNTTAGKMFRMATRFHTVGERTDGGHWNRIATTFITRNHGTVVNHLPSTIDYSHFNAPVTITAPTS
jgi:hypothetical protein